MEEKKIWKKEEIRKMLERNDKAVSRGIIVIYSLQTDYEKVSTETVEHNGIGFNSIDAKFLSSLAMQIIERGTLTERQMEYARKKILKYAGQLTKVANGELKVSV